MLSEKMTLSLTCLLLIFGLVIYVPSAMADHGSFDVSIGAAETMIDVSSADGLQIASGRNRGARTLTAGTAIHLLITTAQVVNLSDPDGTGVEVEDRGDDNALDVTDLVVDAYGPEGRSLGILKNTAETATTIRLSHRDPNNPGREFLVEINATELADAYTAQRGGGTQLEIHTVLFSIPKDKMERSDSAFITLVRNDNHPVSKNNRAAVFRVDLVDNDEGSAAYNSGTGAALAGGGVPGVVAVQSLRERRGFIETGTFQVRVILTEEPHGIADIIKDATKLIAVKNGKATGIAKGATLKGTSTAPAQTGELTTMMVSYTTMAGTAAAADTDLPQPTGRDNKYHQYFVTIEPNPGHNGYVTISVKQFMDQVIPLANQYVPLSDQLIVATTLDTAPETVRNARVANESLMVMVNAAADTTSKGAVAKAAYDARQKVLDAVGNEYVLANKTHIPAGGYLVLVVDRAAANIADPKVKLKEKLSAAQKLYNVIDPGDMILPFPADDLDTFFRNGGTLNLGYADITEATGSGRDESKSPQADKNHADYTGYDGAATKAYAAGDLIINEIMWGLDGKEKTSQYIELHNTTDAAIGIDNLEWVITVGALPDGYAAIDTAGNTPASGFWQVPGMGGATEASPANPTVIDLVSMSRVAGSADGTAAASWAASMRPSENLSGRRVGTPGAANSYVMPAAPAPAPEPAPEPMAPAAEADDIMISEVMVASNGGRLPQWIELANVSGAAVSLSEWSLVVENDSADADVVGGIVEIDLGDTEIGEDQVALVVSKEGRNSGVGDGEGDLRADRIINVQSMVSPDNARYSFISEMGFMISLMPPQTGAVRMYGDSGGNLGMGWDVPMSEDGRSSLIRREMGDAGEIMGTDAAGWVLASDTTLDGAYRTTYYGSDEDSGTPGYNAGGALPVELSMFSAKRNDAGQVVITWETQSELNNAGFFIKRSQQKDGKFVVVNAAMVAGAGTTAEKQSYTYTDRTAQPNVVYYYQIEDVSLDGNRQTLTRAHRLKGHIGAAGKLTTIWGELKSQE